jgi:hypothetical protein
MNDSDHSRHCKNCIHYKYNILGFTSYYERLCKKGITEEHLVTGIIKYESAYFMRSSYGCCGPEGHLFEPKPTLFQTLKSLFK